MVPLGPPLQREDYRVYCKMSTSHRVGPSGAIVGRRNPCARAQDREFGVHSPIAHGDPCAGSAPELVLAPSADRASAKLLAFAATPSGMVGLLPDRRDLPRFIRPEPVLWR